MDISALVLAAALAAPSLSPVDKIVIGGVARWDYVYMDSASKRLYVSHATQTEVVDTQTLKVVGTVAGTNGVHGIAIAADLGLGFTSNGRDNTVLAFDLATLKPAAVVKVGDNPDAIVYVPALQRVVSFNGRSKDLSVIDARSMQVLATVPVGGKPEFAQLGEQNRIYFNIEDTHELAVFDANQLSLTQRGSLVQCEEPTGLALGAQQRVYSVCANHTMVVSSPDGKHQQRVAIGAGPDGVAWMDGYAYSANGGDGTISVVGEDPQGQFKTLATVPSTYGARTIAADPAMHRLYLPTATFTAPDGKGQRSGVADSFQILVMQSK
ncbi:MAG: YncE family protein [Burkholderiaceae bacterium]|nr:YncE family protein [Roseateles sp.]MBV8469378.1 YncE family protein [Burkholderiaceae bacterium]